MGGRFAPLSSADVSAIVTAALTILERVGMAGLPDALAGQALEAGAIRHGDGRVRFPRSMVEDAIGRAARRVDLPGFTDDRSLQIGGGRVHIGTGGAAVKVLEPDQRRFRDAQLADL